MKKIGLSRFYILYSLLTITLTTMACAGVELDPSIGTQKGIIRSKQEIDNQKFIIIGPSQPSPQPPPSPSPGSGSTYANSPFNGLNNTDLRNKFIELNKGARNRGLSQYTAARRFMFKTLDNVNGEVECVYTGRRLQTSDIPDSNDMNTEHTWPQSLGGGDQTKADLHHLFPSDSKVNSLRGNDPFCDSGPIKKTTLGGSKQHKASSGNCFEPRDEHKGNVARAMFYISTMKNLPIDAEQEKTLRRWNQLDPVDDAERKREEAIFQFEKSHNYFVIYPDLADHINNF